MDASDILFAYLVQFWCPPELLNKAAGEAATFLMGVKVHWSLHEAAYGNKTRSSAAGPPLSRSIRVQGWMRSLITMEPPELSLYDPP